MPSPNPERKKMMLEALDSGLSPKEVAQRFGVKPARVNAIHREAYGPTLRRSDPKYQKLEDKVRVLEGKVNTLLSIVKTFFEERQVQRVDTIRKK